MPILISGSPINVSFRLFIFKDPELTFYFAYPYLRIPNQHFVLPILICRVWASGRPEAGVHGGHVSAAEVEGLAPRLQRSHGKARAQSH